MHGEATPAQTHALIILRLGVDSWACRCWSLGQHDARHYFMLQDALILAANRRACLWLHGGPVVEGCEMKTGTVVHTGVTTRGLLAHELSILSSYR